MQRKTIDFVVPFVKVICSAGKIAKFDPSGLAFRNVNSQMSLNKPTLARQIVYTLAADSNSSRSSD
jgi:hypothetical protein